ncbi:CoA transferase [Rhodococcus sp. 06-156-3C]|uniref:CaiB/BaiF CoA transferase family protein n=1 Tax=Nocardiaceae TaxID=85025 RepID=UPI000522FFD4|nr:MULTISPECIES: CaiB/BaiF CoA-transferase family protein [Rhodococcus]OZD08788.1 CoA transferase [Rhodococcus sp. 06-156-4C]OZD17380.1 CoA transferase [Rhodococcus sp. 06-156-3C]OZD18718.1 CoA transferase [Rhodococcus sp. 06-156-4a]OZD25109.1 CoA transferase [Rhodococcus sp. 06-156-3b]OZD34268.1 CoA transferase [Rhodococcus sp. 06-156-3]
MTGSASLPLAGITVVSIEQAVAAPFATRQLADLGARVIKIERPDGGDFARRYDQSVNGEASYFVWLNRSKESLTVDLKSEDGRAVLEQLLGTADVFVQNLAPGAAARMDLDAESLQKRFPRLIPCDVSGYGNTGPWSERKAYDMLVQGESGLMSLTGPNDVPSKVGLSIADISAGMYAYSGILTALFTRATTGVVHAVEVALFEALGEWMGSPAYYTEYGGKQPGRVGAEHATIVPYGPFPTSDGTVLLSIQNEREWLGFCTDVLQDASLATDPRFVNNTARVAHRAECNALISARTDTMPTSTVLELLDKVGIANGRLAEVADFLSHPSLAGRERWREVDTPGGKVRALLPPANLSGVEPRFDPVPALGAHTDSILAELGIRSEDAQSSRGVPEH